MIANIPYRSSIDVEAEDIVAALDNDDEKISQFICEIIAHAESVDLRERLLSRLGADIVGAPDAGGKHHVVYDPKFWEDNEYIGMNVPTQQQVQDDA